MKKLLWTALAAVVTTAAAAGALHLLAYVWRRVAHEEPPEQPGWAKLFVRKPLRAGVKRAVQPPQEV